MRKLVVTALAVAFVAATARPTPAAAPKAVRLDCSTHVLALVFLPSKRLVDIGDAAHRRLLVADRRHYVFRSTCHSVLGQPVLLRGTHAATTKATRLGCVFSGRVQLIVERSAAGVQVLAALPGSARALFRADLEQRPTLAYDRRWCRSL